MKDTSRPPRERRAKMAGTKSWWQRLHEVYHPPPSPRPTPPPRPPFRPRPPRPGRQLEDMYQKAVRRYPTVDFRVNCNQSDMTLANRWVRGRNDYDRCIAARCGELGALSYFRQFCATVRDVSITQLDSDQAADWRSHDIEVEGRFIDVKNRRRVIGRQVEHFVQRPKQHANSDVEIVATNTVTYDRSNASNRTAGGIDVGAATNVVVVGCTDGPTLTECAGRIQHQVQETIPHLDIAGMLAWQPRARLPPWAFDYNDEHYAARQELLSSDSRFSTVLGKALRRGDSIPPYLSAFAAAHDMSGISVLASMDSLFGDLRAHFRSTGVTRASIFAFILMYLLRNPTGTNRSAHLRQAFYPDSLDASERTKYPLGTHDPERCVSDGIKALSQLLKHNPSVRHATRFSLRSSSILRGLLGGRWRTLISYCGNCGHWPLVWNVDKVADCAQKRGCEHGRLICCYCDCCGAPDLQGCRESTTHQSHLAPAVRHAGWRKNPDQIRRD